MHKNIGKKSQFPERAQWTPPGREISDTEKLYLQGPSAQVTFLRKATVKDPNTGRVDEYSAAESQSKHFRISCYYVTISHSTQAQSPQFEWILSLFEHRFVRKTYQWAVIEECCGPIQDRVKIMECVD